MSRIAKKPIIVPLNVEIILNDRYIEVKNNNKGIKCFLNKSVIIDYIKNTLLFKSKFDTCDGWVQAGTMRSLVNSMIVGVTVGFSKKLKLVGVGYRINIEKENKISMLLGYSHEITYLLPKGIIAESISPTEIILKGIDKQLIGQVAANLRFKRKPESYKGKGVRYFDEVIRIKEAKKK